MSIRLTKRDHRLLTKCAASQWLTTAQVQRVLAFSTPNATQKRLRKLSSAGLLHSLRPHRMAEALHTVGPKGKQILSERGIIVKTGRRLPAYIDHLIGTNDIRIFFEQSGVPIQSFFAFWELSQFNWNYPVVPDSLCSIDAGAPLTLAIEYDRSTERLEMVSKKLMTYAIGQAGFPFDAVLVVAERPKRLDTLRLHIGKRIGSFDGLIGSSLDQIRRADKKSKIFTNLYQEMVEKYSLLDLVKIL